MKQRDKILSVIILGGALLLGIYGARLFYNTFQYSGDRAVEGMSAEDLQLYEKVSQITGDMSAEEVYLLVGEPTVEFLGQAQWDHFGGSRFSQMRLQFIDGRPMELTWIKFGSFVYDRRFRRPEPEAPATSGTDS